MERYSYDIFTEKNRKGTPIEIVAIDTQNT